MVDRSAAGSARRSGGSARTRPPAPAPAGCGGVGAEARSPTRPGGVVVCAGIHMSDIPSFPYKLLWKERFVRSVANMTRQDGRDFLAIAARVRIETHVERYDLADANRALAKLRTGGVRGAAVL